MTMTMAAGVGAPGVEEALDTAAAEDTRSVVDGGKGVACWPFLRVVSGYA